MIDFMHSPQSTTAALSLFKSRTLVSDCFVYLFMTIGELHVTPLTGILQMRPSFSYLDKADNKTREREAANEGVSALHV